MGSCSATTGKEFVLFSDLKPFENVVPPSNNFVGFFGFFCFGLVFCFYFMILFNIMRQHRLAVSTF